MLNKALLRHLLPALWIAALLPHPAAAQSFQGTFADRGMAVRLDPLGGDRYAGTLSYDGHSYDLDAAVADGELHGSFVTETGSFELRARLSGEVLELVTNTVTYTLRRTVGPVDEPSLPAPAGPPAEADSPGDGTRDADLVGVWRRGAIAADAGRRLPDAAVVELAGGGSYIVWGGAVERRGRWRTAGPTLLLRPAGADRWTPYCRYRVVADTLLCSFDDGSRQLWFRK